MKVFGQRESGLAQGFRFRPGRVRLGEIRRHLVFRFLERGDIQCSSPQAGDLAAGVPARKTTHPNPADLAVRFHNAKPFVKVPAAGRFIQLGEHMNSIVRVDDLLVGGRVLKQ